MVAYLIAAGLTVLVVSFVRSGSCTAKVIKVDEYRAVVTRRYINGEPRVAKTMG